MRKCRVLGYRIQGICRNCTYYAVILYSKLKLSLFYHSIICSIIIDTVLWKTATSFKKETNTTLLIPTPRHFGDLQKCSWKKKTTKEQQKKALLYSPIFEFAAKCYPSGLCYLKEYIYTP